MRLNRYIAECGLASRRGADELVFNGKVKVNGVVVKEPGRQVSEKDEVQVGGEVIAPKEGKIYAALNKPRGVTTTKADKHAKKTVMQLLPREWTHVNPAGRLDKDSTGLLIFSNDGDFVFRLTHPKHLITKEYWVLVSGILKKTEIDKLEKGVVIDGKKTAPAEVSDVRKGENKTNFKIVLQEGRNRQIRKMCHKVGHEVIELKRLRMGKIELGDLAVGKFRKLTKEEIDSVRLLELE